MLMKTVTSFIARTETHIHKETVRVERVNAS